jgi:GNAT superfamily N-acetyltransferase
VGLVRDAGRLDAEVCAAIHVASWKAAYRGMMPDEYLDGLCVDDRLPAWREMLAAERAPQTVIVVIEDDGVVRGFATCRPTADTPTCGEVGAIYLEPDTWERGLGRQLMAAVVERASSSGLRELTLWVHTQNSRARAFYTRTGWTDDGVQRSAVVWGVEVPERRYRLVLSTS